MVLVKSATYGDEFSSTNVLNSLKDRLSSSESVIVDSSLVPAVSRVTGAGATTLDEAEQKEAKDLAIGACGGASDQTCVELKTQEFAQKRLREKETESQSPASIVKGRRLTVELVGADGKPRRVVIPEGQKFELDAPPDANAFDTRTTGSVLTSIGNTLGSTLLTLVTTFIYAGSVFLTWFTFEVYNKVVLQWVMMILAILIPYSGILFSAIGGIYYYMSKRSESLRAAALSKDLRVY